MRGIRCRFSLVIFLLVSFLFHAPFALAAEPPKLDAANTAWMLTASVLVLFMTLPGLALFYAGLVRMKNVLSVLMQCFAITCVVTLAWVIVAYSIAFGDGGASNAWYGGFAKAFMSGVDFKALKGTSRRRCSRCSSSPSRSSRLRSSSAPTQSA